MKDLQGIVGDENTGEEIENSGELRVEILLQVKVQVMQGPYIPYIWVAPSVFIPCVLVNASAVSGCFFIPVQQLS